MKQDVKNCITDNFTIDIAPSPEAPQKTVWKECDKHNMFVLDSWEDDSEASISVNSLQSIAQPQHGASPNTSESTHEEIILAINVSRSVDVDWTTHAIEQRLSQIACHFISTFVHSFHSHFVFFGENHLTIFWEWSSSSLIHPIVSQSLNCQCERQSCVELDLCQVNANQAMHVHS